jgi:dihydrofolate synthase/folylpolyglutamate synthase
MNFAQALEFLETLPDMERARHGSGITMSVDSMKRLLELLGHPEKGTKTIHITGSKGKGSTATLIASILRAAGFRTAVFTSPHLHSYRERIAFDLRPVSEHDFANGVEAIAQILHENSIAAVGPISTFGVLTALFFHLVAKFRPAVDWQIVEVGLGGTYDATNVFTEKDIAILTPISLEHTAILGSDTGAIAKQKVGIITAGTTVVLAPQRDRIVRDVVSTACEKMGARFIDVAEKFRFERVSFDENQQRFRISDGADVSEFEIALAGEHQIVNASTALVVIDALKDLGSPIDDTAKQKGLKNARLPGRFEVFPAGIAPDGRSSRTTFVLDGAHNEDSARALAQALNDYFPRRNLTFILALNHDKKVEEFWAEISRCSHEVVVTKTDNPRALEPTVLKERITNCDAHAQVSCAPTFGTAFELASARLKDNGVICVTGSLYLVAEARELLAVAQHCTPFARPICFD